MNGSKIGEFDIETTLMGGQAFSWKKIGDYYYGATQERILKVQYEDKYLMWQTYPERDDYEFIKRYFKLDRNYPEILQQIDKDQYMRKAIEEFPGLRLLEQDFEQTLISYIISANNNIKKIRLSTNLLSRSLGREVVVDDMSFYTFPQISDIAQLSIDELKETKVGYRAPYLQKSSKILLESSELSEIKTFSESTAREKLEELPGIGPKVADCILLYSLSFEEITPFDIWAKRFVSEYYGIDENSKYTDLRNWARDYFNGYAGWGGQFLFEYIRKNYNK